MNFHLLLPTSLPKERAELCVLPDSRAVEMLTITEELNLAGSDAAALKILRRALRLFPVEALTTPVKETDASGIGPATDRVFHITRVQGDSSEILVYTAVAGYCTLLDEVLDAGTHLDPKQWSFLRSGFTALFRMLAGAEPPTEPPVLYTPTSRADSQNRPDSVRRWFRGHYGFFVILQGIASAIQLMVSHVRRSELLQGRDALVTASILMRAASVAFRFTGDFPGVDYENRVRPNMMPPTAPPKVSGLQLRDHKYMVRALAAARPVLTCPPSELASCRDSFYEALLETYESHKFVCSSFLDDTSATLISSDLDRTPEQSHLSTLEYLKGLRLALVSDPPPHSFVRQETSDT